MPRCDKDPQKNKKKKEELSRRYSTRARRIMLLPLLAAAAAPVDTHTHYLKRGANTTIKIYRYICIQTHQLHLFIALSCSLAFTFLLYTERIRDEESAAIYILIAQKAKMMCEFIQITNQGEMIGKKEKNADQSLSGFLFIIFIYAEKVYEVLTGGVAVQTFSFSYFVFFFFSFSLCLFVP